VSLRILFVDPVAEHRGPLTDAFRAAGLEVRSVEELAGLGRTLLAHRPHLVLVRAELRSALALGVLDALASDTSLARVPVGLICRDGTDRRFLGQLRCGVVALFEEPFEPARHRLEVLGLLAELHARTGTLCGQGEGRELAALVEHLRRGRRSGALTVNPRTPEEGKALFVRGALRSAEHLGAQGPEALVSMVGTPKAAWSFCEVGGAGGEVLVDMDIEPAADEPLGASGATGLELQIGEPMTGEQEVPIVMPGEGRREPAGRSVLPILLVDDDESLCRMFTLLFRKHGFEVHTASDGFAGYEAALQRPFDLIVADLDMPRMDGWGMLRLVRDDFRTRELPVVFLSCHDDYRQTLRAQDCGAQGYFSKSTRLDALATQVRRVLEPRLEASRELGTHHTLPLAVGALGPQWLACELAQSGRSGRLEAKDGWATYRLVFWDGRPVHAFAQAGRHQAHGERAFNAFVASRGAQGHFERGEFPAEVNLHATAEALCAQAASLLNRNEAKIRDGLLVHATDIRVDKELYALYAQVGPGQWLETARLVCEQGLPPREVIARVDASPLEVEETMRDLIRRGVVRLSG
jgi:DNA-binding response OmpR family regulator